MKIRFYAIFRQLTGCSNTELSYPNGATLEEVLAQLLKDFPDLKSAMFDESGALYRHVHIIIDGRDIPYNTNYPTILAPDQSIDIFPAIGGGVSTNPQQ